MLKISPACRRALRARAHALNPVVVIGDKGLSPSVLRELDVCLEAHELIKVRSAGADRPTRENLLTTICTKLNAAPVQHIGKILVIFRPAAEQNSASGKAQPENAGNESD